MLFSARRAKLLFLVVGCFVFLRSGESQILSVDLGHEFFKVALLRPGMPAEILLNGHSKRKTPTAVSFFETVRAFGDDALAHQGKAPSKVPMFFHSLLGHRFKEDDVSQGGSWWTSFGLSDQFYSFNLGFDKVRGVPTFIIADDMVLVGEQVLANIFQFAQKLAQASSDGTPVRELVVTMSPHANLRQRQSVVAAAEIAGLRLLALVHEGSAFAVLRAIDYVPEKGSVERALFYNLGSRKTEASIVQFESRQAGMVPGRSAPAVTILGAAIDFGIGGHLMDLKIADHMLKRFQEKNPSLSSGIANNSRALRKLLSQSQKTKAVLSANKNAGFSVESLFSDVDFHTSITREEFESLCEEMFSRLTAPVDAALGAANLTLQDIQHVELVGGAWRVPKVQQILSDFTEKHLGKKLPLGQHLNGEEGAALGAAFVGANLSNSFRVKRIFLKDLTTHAYGIQMVVPSRQLQTNITTPFPVGTHLGAQTELVYAVEDDFVLRLLEDNVLIATYECTGLHEALAHKWSGLNMTGSPSVVVPVHLDTSGIIDIRNPKATIEELYWVNVTNRKSGSSAARTRLHNATDNSSSVNAETDNMSSDGKTSSSSTSVPVDKRKPTGNATANHSGSNGKDEVEVVSKQKKRQHQIELALSRTDLFPLPASKGDIAVAKRKLRDITKNEEEIAAVNQIRNDLESLIYTCRDTVERDDIMKVSSLEQREKVREVSMEYEEWMYEPGASRDKFQEKFSTLHALVESMESRASELEARHKLVDTVKEAIENVGNTRAHIKKKMKWVSTNATQEALKKLTEFEDWWRQKQQFQARLPLHEEPAFTKKEVVDKLTKVQRYWDWLKNTVEPKEKPNVNSTTNASTNAVDGVHNDTNASVAKDAALSSDPATVRKEILAVREKKAAAVEQEHFDAALSFRVEEHRLKLHLSMLSAKSEEL